ncbi:Bax inhibitor-1 family protein [Planctomycetes bacterium K23_9]|uniref:Inhibitor of apoptosis-promoting Bax1 n=1 Tax=Stieleria marina TaxID=1930275 RepID=A0A517NWJ9_9BACT|nr:Inhibitor of apoptosis-promoting Bax1 [Planctomycetes bacterium K23_9]
MSNVNPYASAAVPVAFAEESARAAFIRRTYLHVAGAVLALVALETVIFTVVPEDMMRGLVQKMSGMGWLLVLGAYMGVSWMARSWATSSVSKGGQYAGLGLYVVAESVILLPLLYVSMLMDPNLPLMAGIISVMCFGCLTAFVMMTNVDLSSWGKYLAIAGFAALAAIVAGMICGFSLGLFFCGAMIALACGYILYDTSNVIHHYNTDQHVAASLALFASLVLLFWYVLRIAMMFASDD